MIFFDDKVFLQISVSIATPSLLLDLDTDESYSLDVAASGESGAGSVVRVRIRARTFFGARHGMETLSQAITYDEYTKRLQVSNRASFFIIKLLRGKLFNCVSALFNET